jgi:hypothetical protein
MPDVPRIFTLPIPFPCHALEEYRAGMTRLTVLFGADCRFDNDNQVYFHSKGNSTYAASESTDEG